MCFQPEEFSPIGISGFIFGLSVGGLKNCWHIDLLTDLAEVIPIIFSQAEAL